MLYPERERRVLLVLVLVLASLLIYVSLGWNGRYNVSEDLTKPPKPLFDPCPSTNRLTGFYIKSGCSEPVYQQRRNQYQSVCKTFDKGKVVRIYRTGNTAYCQVPKVGSTFWLSVYYFLNENATYSSPFDIPRHIVHYNMTKRPSSLTQPGVAQQINTDFRFMFVREPYSRLFSAYIDKILLPDFWFHYGGKLMKFLRGRRMACPSDVTFKQFVRFVVLEEQKQGEIGDHWRPIHRLCNPCLFQPHVVGKMESFAQDSQHVLSAMDRSRVSSSVNRDERVHHELDMLIDFNVALLKRSDVRRCTDLSGIARRLWTAFQLNGYIPTEVTLPKRFLTSPFMSGPERPKKEYADRFKRFVHKTYNSVRSRTKEAWRKQRQEALVEAYRPVSDELMAGLQKLYQHDFELFAYDPRPEQLFRGRKRS